MYLRSLRMFLWLPISLSVVTIIHIVNDSGCVVKVLLTDSIKVLYMDNT